MQYGRLLLTLFTVALGAPACASAGASGGLPAPPAVLAASSAPAAGPPVAPVAVAAPAPAPYPRPAAARPAPARPARVAAPSAGERVAAVEAAFDESGWDWRAAGITVRLGHHPKACCHWGVYDRVARAVWVGPGAFATQRRLRYVALHELGHAWQWSTGHLGILAADMGPWGRTGGPAFEAGADCIATRWGATGRGHYWACPPEAAAVVGRRLAGDWGS